MKLFNTTAAMLMLVMSMLLGNSALAQTPADPLCPDLTTDAGVVVGMVCVAVDPLSGNVFVNYSSSDDWKLSEVNLWIGDNEDSLIVNLANSSYIRSEGNPGELEHQFEIPFSDLTIDFDNFCNAEVFVAANAVVTRTVAGEPNGDGKSDKSGKSGKSGKSDKSDKSDKSAKNSKSDKSAKASKGKDKAAKKSKGKDKNKSGKSGQSDKSGKSGKSGVSGGTGPVTETFTAWAGVTPVGNGSYFSFSNDFCVVEPPVEPPLITLPSSACYNTYASSLAWATTSFDPAVHFAEAA
jgi:hypothetical protein